MKQFIMLLWEQFCLLFIAIVNINFFFSAELLSGISKEVKAGRLPSNLAALMEELYHNYKNAVNKYTWTYALMYIFIYILKVFIVFGLNS